MGHRISAFELEGYPCLYIDSTIDGIILSQLNDLNLQPVLLPMPRFRLLKIAKLKHMFYLSKQIKEFDF
jgi:hypothetical protein